MFTADQIVAHLVGDYLLQSHWMATEKTKRTSAAIAHVVLYAIPFLFISRNPAALAFIIGTHFAIDRWRLARYVVWAKNVRIFTNSFGYADFDWHPWATCKGTGYPDDVPPWLSVWLLIIADNTLHLICNATALWAFP